MARAKTHGGRGAVGGDEVVEGDDGRVAADGCAHLLFEAGIACGFLSVKDPEGGQAPRRARAMAAILPEADWLMRRELRGANFDRFSAPGIPPGYKSAIRGVMKSVLS